MSRSNSNDGLVAIKEAQTRAENAALVVLRQADIVVEMAVENPDGSWTVDAETMAPLIAAKRAYEDASGDLSLTISRTLSRFLGGA